MSCDMAYMAESKKNDTDDLIYNTEADWDLDNELTVIKQVGWVRGIDWEFVIGLNTLLYLKQITNKYLP